VNLFAKPAPSYTQKKTQHDHAYIELKVNLVGEMLVKIFSTATLIVVAWLSVQLLQTKQSSDFAQANFQQTLAELRADLNSATEQNESLSSDLLARMDELSAQQATFKASSNKGDPNAIKAKNQTITRMRETADLQVAYATVLEADLAANDKNGAEASKLLKSTKTAIWKTSDKWKKSKGALRDLMGPIDVLAGKWDRGDFSGNTKSIQKTLIDVLNTQSKP